MKRTLFGILSTVVLAISPATAAEDVPRGFEPISAIKEAQSEAASKKKLVVLVVKGMDDACPNCAAALENGLKAVGSGVVKVFARAEKIGEADQADFTPALKDRIRKQFTRGAAVTFVVFDPEMTKIITEAGRRELQNDKKATAEFKKTVQQAKKDLK